MTPRQKLELRASEIRVRLAELGALDQLTDEQSSELDALRNEYKDVEKRAQALTVAGDEPMVTETRETAEARELRDLENRSNVGEILDSVLGGHRLEGATRELQQHLGLESNQVPLALLREAAHHELETRAAHERLETRAVTPAPTNVGQNQSEIIPYVFPQAVAAFLGVDTPTVGVGEAVYPVLTSELSVEALGENATGTETTGAFSADVLSPSRLQASFFYSREDRARFRGMDAALRMNLSDGLADALDAQILAGTNGLLTGTNLADHNVTAITNFADYVSNFGYSRVDGRFAAMTGDLRVVMGSATYAHAGTVYRGNNSEETALDRLMRTTRGVRVSAHVPAVASNRQNGVIRLGMNRDMVAPIWEGVTLIPDEITKAANGQIVVTGVMLHAVKILRRDGFYKQQCQHS